MVLGEGLVKVSGELMEFGMFGNGIGDCVPLYRVFDFSFWVVGVLEWEEKWGVGSSISSSESSSISKAGVSGWKSSSGTLESQASITGSFQGRQSFMTHLFLYSSTVS